MRRVEAPLVAAQDGEEIPPRRLAVADGAEIRPPQPVEVREAGADAVRLADCRQSPAACWAAFR